MANYLSDRTGASIDTVLDNADAGNIGKTAITQFNGDVDTLETTGHFTLGGSATNGPEAANASLVVTAITTLITSQLWMSTSVGKVFFRTQNGGVWNAWQEIYHTGNTGVVRYGTGFAGNEILFNPTTALCDWGRTGTADTAVLSWQNDNGVVGQVRTNGTATAYNTSSDPRLKDFAEAPTDSVINAEFNSLFSCFRTFNWKSDPQGDLVWGFDAHACVDAGTGIASEGEGSRGLNLGDTYETIPAVTENRVVNDAEGNPTSEIETVVITAAIEKKVSPAGVDQSKGVPVLLAMIEMQKRQIAALNSRLDLAGL